MNSNKGQFPREFGFVARIKNRQKLEKIRLLWFDSPDLVVILKATIGKLHTACAAFHDAIWQCRQPGRVQFSGYRRLKCSKMQGDPLMFRKTLILALMAGASLLVAGTGSAQAFHHWGGGCGGGCGGYEGGCGGGCGGFTGGCGGCGFHHHHLALFHHHGCGCEAAAPSCGCGAPAPSCGCGAPAPSCGCGAPAPAPSCCAPAPTCCAPAPSCSAPAPSCGCGASAPTTMTAPPMDGATMAPPPAPGTGHPVAPPPPPEEPAKPGKPKA